MVAPGGARLLRTLVAAAVFSAIGIAPSEARPAAPASVMHCGLPDVSTGARTCSYTFAHSRTIETFVVPPTTGPVQITAVGAPGFGEDAARSRGARVTGSFSVLSGTPLFIAVGGDGFYDGYNGGAQGGGGGGAGGDGADHLWVDSQPGSGGGGSSLVPPGGRFSLSNVLEPSVTITLTQYG